MIDFAYCRNVTISLPRTTRRNGTLYMYAFAFPYTNSNDWEMDAQSQKTMIAYFKLTEYLVPQAEPINLLGTEPEKVNAFYYGFKAT